MSGVDSTNLLRCGSSLLRLPQGLLFLFQADSQFKGFQFLLFGETPDLLNDFQYLGKKLIYELFLVRFIFGNIVFKPSSCIFSVPDSQDRTGMYIRDTS